MRHDIVVSAERLNYLFAILVYSDWLAQSSISPLSCHLVKSNSACLLTRVLCPCHLVGALLSYCLGDCVLICNHDSVRIDRSFPAPRNALLQLDLLRSELGALNFAVVSPFIKLYVRLRIPLIWPRCVQLSSLRKESSVVSSTLFNRLCLVVKIAALSWTLKVADGLFELTVRFSLALIGLVPLDWGLPVACTLTWVAFEGHFAPMDWNYGVHHVLKWRLASVLLAAVLFTQIIIVMSIAHLVHHSIVSLLESYSNSALLSLLG